MSMAIPKTGYLATFRILGVPTYIHWSFPTGGLVIAFWLGNFHLPTIIAAVGAYMALVLVHELGHAFFAKLNSSKVHAIVIAFGGGCCFADPAPSSPRAILFYAGGLIFQSLLFIATVCFLVIFGRPAIPALGVAALVFTLVNIFLLLSNIVPYKDNDGSMLLRAFKAYRSEA